MCNVTIPPTFLKSLKSKILVLCLIRFGDKLDDDLKSIFDDLRILLPESYPKWLPKESIHPQVLQPE